MDWKHLLPYLGPILVVALLARRVLRNPPRKVKIWRMFIAPVVIVLAVSATLAVSPMPGPLWIVGFVIALALGAGVGFLTTHHQEFSIDEDGDVSARATPIGTVLVVGLFAVRYGIKYLTGSGGNTYAPAMHPAAGVIGWTDVGLMFSTGLVFARVVTTWVHARPLIEAHKAQKAIAQAAPPPSGDAPPGNP